jgi:hypothetical protein
VEPRYQPPPLGMQSDSELRRRRQTCAPTFRNFSLGVAEGEDRGRGELPTLVIVRCREPVGWLDKLGCVRLPIGVS